MKRSAIAIVIVLVAVGVFALLQARPKHAAYPNFPDLMPRAGEQTPSTEFNKAQADLAKYRLKIKEHPEKLENYDVVAEIYLQEARVTAKHHEYVPIADTILDYVLAKNPKQFEAMVTKAGIYMTKHRFAEARELIEKAVVVNPYNSGAFGVLCDACTELGDYDAAVKASDKMLSIRPDLRSYARASYQRELRGDEDGAIAAMRMAADAGLFGSENREWALYHLGTLYMNQAKLDTAAYIFHGILEERPKFAYAMSGLGMVEAAKRQYGEAGQHLVQASQFAPEHLFVEQLADVYMAMGDSTIAKQMEDKVLEAFRLHEADGWNVDRERAQFLLNHNRDLGEALTRMKREYAKRPKNADVCETYALALMKNDRATEAASIIEGALRLGNHNALLHFHAAQVFAAARNTQRASTEVNLAMAQDSYLTPTTQDEARKMQATLASAK